MKYRDFKDVNQGLKALVCGLGPSFVNLEPFKRQPDMVLIGVNEADTVLSMDVTILINDYDPKNISEKSRQEKVKKVNSDIIFSIPFSKGFTLDHPEKVIEISLSRETEQIGLDRNPYSIINQGKMVVKITSVWCALSFAIWSGCDRIGIIGFDFYGSPIGCRGDKIHELAKPYIVEQLNQIARNFVKHQPKGIEIVNLSQESKISAFPKMKMEDFIYAF